MPRTTNVKEFRNGSAEARTQTPSVEEQLWSLVPMASYLETNKRREEKFGQIVEQIIFTWPWFYLPRLDEMLVWIDKHNLPDWALEVYKSVIADIKSGELTNSAA
jgi:hypothetical protein